MQNGNIILNKLSAGIIGTVFYFDTVFNPDEYIILLYDQNKKLFHKFNNRMDVVSSDGATLTFGTLDPETEYLTLLFHHIKTGESASFNYYLTEKPSFPAAVHVNDHLRLNSGADQPYIYLENMIASDVITKIFYAQRWLNGHYTAPDISLFEGASIVTPNQHKPVDYIFQDQDLVLSLLTFVPLRSLKSRIFIEISDCVTEIELSRQPVRQSDARAEAETSIREAFLTRLAFKSFEIDAGDIVGFDSSLLYDRVLMQNYDQEQYEAAPMYSAQVSAGIFDYGRYLAVVEEEWVVIGENEIIHFKNTHQIVAQRVNGQYIITSDKIIK
ncbi:MAG: hypothetical protein FWE82_09905 [Defluviitaleaceae bacterium]|nr:hypothetical protein [Defluviitaleaceae bacterium]